MQGLNLIRDAWIPVRHRSGRRSIRAPFELFGDVEDPIIAIASPRADLDGGIVQWLIGMLHVAFSPERDSEWARLSRTRPNAQVMQEKLAPFEPYFELLGDGIRVYQDASVAKFGGEAWRIEKILADLGLGPGFDHFARIGSVRQLCLRCTAAGLVTLQATAPPGGRGHFASLRGVGPLTTLVCPADPEADLWSLLWLNVVPLSRLRAATDADEEELAPERVFPWLDTPKSEPKTTPDRLPQHFHPHYVFFTMPRRIWLGAPAPGECGLCGQETLVLSDYQTRPNGNRYPGGVWIHPLSPYYRNDEKWWTVKGDERSLGYRHWLGLVINKPGGDSLTALPVRLLKSRQAGRADLAGNRLRLWAFGYALSNICALAWNDSRMPIYELSEELEPPYSAQILRMVEGASKVEYFVRTAFKKLIARRPQDVKNEPLRIVARFWEETEPPFYEHAARMLDWLRGFPPGEVSGEPVEILSSWHALLCSKARKIFDSEVDQIDFRAADPGQVANAWNELNRALYGTKLKESLGLPVDSEKKKKGGRK